MRIINRRTGETMLESEIDLDNGFMCGTMFVIKEDVAPLDDEKTFYDDEDYEEVALYQSYPENERIQDKITELKNKLSVTDYIVIKIAEGAATTEEYASIISDREAWRAEINELENKL